MRTTQLLTFGLCLVLLAGCGGGKNETGEKEEASEHPVTHQAAPAATPAADPAALAAHGMDLFSHNCVTCHGVSGKGDGPGAAALNPKPRDFTNVAYMDKLSDSDIRNTIKYGGSIKGMPQMPSNPQYGDHDLAALVAYVRTFSHPKRQRAALPCRACVGGARHAQVVMSSMRGRAGRGETSRSHGP